jgi:hypothetical protein
VAAKLEEVKEVRDHPRKLLEMVMVAVDRSINRRETPDGRKLAVLDTHSKVGDAERQPCHCLGCTLVGYLMMQCCLCSFLCAQ